MGPGSISGADVSWCEARLRIVRSAVRFPLAAAACERGSVSDRRRLTEFTHCR